MNTDSNAADTNPTRQRGMEPNPSLTHRVGISGNDWPHVPLKTVCRINPRRSARRDVADDEPTSFVPMPAVDAERGEITEYLERPFGEIKKGYTYFENGDVIFAKITPCMQNGKHAICRNLRNGFGFGSTEFHVLRPEPSLLTPFLHLFLRQPSLLEDAERFLTGAVGQQRLPENYLTDLEIPLPPLAEQERIAARLTEQLAAVASARAAAQARLAAAEALPGAYLREAFEQAERRPGVDGARMLSALECLEEVTEGVGTNWSGLPLYGATRNGIAPAKEAIGKYPERYKPVRPGTIFYNPMRILLGSIALLDDDGIAGITSPDYVVIRGRQGILHHRVFYYWLRSEAGEHLIRTLARGGVRERILFNRLCEGRIPVLPWPIQLRLVEQLKEIPQLCRQICSQLAAIDALPAALLRDAFNGYTESKVG